MHLNIPTMQTLSAESQDENACCTMLRCSISIEAYSRLFRPYNKATMRSLSRFNSSPGADRGLSCALLQQHITTF